MSVENICREQDKKSEEELLREFNNLVRDGRETGKYEKAWDCYRNLPGHLQMELRMNKRSWYQTLRCSSA